MLVIISNTKPGKRSYRSAMNTPEPGTPQSHSSQEAQAPQAKSKSSLPGWLIVLFVVLGVIVVLMSTLGVIAIYGVRKYIANAKMAEARNTLGQIAKDASSAYEDEGVLPSKGPARGKLCPSASLPVPADARKVSGMKFQSDPSDWKVDAARNAGFSCLKFSMTAPQYFQYNYTASATAMTASARGDLNGDGVFSYFELKGEVNSGIFVVAPALTETNPDE
jgi:type IV pilus assembly protein PilA